MAERPKAVLFVCNLNRVRSPMAVGLTRLRYDGAVVADSAGLVASGEVDPFAVAVMQELGVDISSYTPKSFEALDDRQFDLVVALTPEAERRVQARAGHETEGLAAWAVGDPAVSEGSREQRLDAYRRCRDELDRLIQQALGPSAAAVSR
jgi:protein-tyrosine-phosphatase